MTKASELREQTDEQLAQRLKEAYQNMFRLRLQGATEKLEAPSEIRKTRREIARILTIQNQRVRERAAEAVVADEAPVEPATAGA